jgi:hypothetical protein
MEAHVVDAREAWWRRLPAVLAYLIVLLLVSAASFNGFYDKWGFRDDRPRFSVQLMLDGEADRPFVYRRLNVWVAQAISDVTPEQVKVAVQSRAKVWDESSKIGPDHTLAASPQEFWRYNVLYYLTFLEWFAAVTVLAALCGRYVGLAAGAGAASVFALVFPILLSVGGYFYDFPEILFFASAAYAASRGWLVPLAAIVLVGTANKETMVFFAPTLIPFLALRYGWIRATALSGALSVAAGLVYLYIRDMHAANPGGAFEFHLLASLKFYSNPANLLEMEKTYGLSLFRPYSLVGIAFMFAFVAAGWRSAPPPLRAHFALAVLVNMPLFILMGWPGELRNLSLTFVGWTLLAAVAIRGWMDRRPAPARALA